MQPNTGSVANQAVNFANFSVEKKPFKSDPFWVVEGRYVGSDGFVVPKDFDEFHERFPNYVRNWVKRHAGDSASKEEVEDWTQDLLIHLRYLPLSSEHRNFGKDDVIQTFDPVKHYGANQARFQNYVNLCLANKFRTIRSKEMKDALSQLGNVSLDTQRESGDPFSVSDEFCHWHSDHLQRAANTSGKQDQDGALLREFVDFIRSEDPNVLPAVEALFLAQRQRVAARSLGMTEAQFSRTRNRLVQLGRCFLTGEPAPKQRKTYKKRVKRSRTRIFAGTGVPGMTRPLLDPRIDPCKGGDDLDQTFAGAVLSESTPLGLLTVGG